MNNLRSGVGELFDSIKFANDDSFKIAIEGTDGFSLVPVRSGSDTDMLVPLLTQWRRDNIEGFTKIFDVKEEGTASWLQKGVLERKDRILFLVVDSNGEMYGHVGLSSFDSDQNSCEIDNIVRGKRSLDKGLFYFSCNTLINWTRANFKDIQVGLRVLNDNNKALAMYYRLGFQPVELIPLERIESEGEIEWLPCGDDAGKKIDKFFIRMTIAGLN